MTILIMLAHIPSVILRYLPYEDIVDKKQRNTLIFCYCCYLIFNFITTYIIDLSVGTSLIIYEANILISCIILATINAVVIKGYVYQHLFVFGYVASIYLMIQTISAFIVHPMNSLIGQRGLIMGNTAYFLLLFIVFYVPISKITRTTIKHYLTKENNYWRHLWYIPNAMFASGFFFILESGWVENISQLVAHIILGASTVWICRTVAYDFSKIQETESYKVELEYSRQQNKLQEKYYDALSENIETARKSRHDVKHHLNVLNGYLINNDQTGLKEYLQEYIESNDAQEYIPFTGNSNVDALLYSHHKAIKANNIELSVSCDLSDIGDIKEIDLCTLMGNAIENAIEANQYVYENRFIKICSIKEDDTLIITIDNSFDGKIDKREGIFYSRKQLDRKGVGTASMVETCHKYNGMCKFEYKDKVFYTSFLLNTHI